MRRKDSLLTRIYEGRAGYFFILPAMLVLGIFFVFPICYTLVMSFYYWGDLTIPSFLGFENYLDVFSDESFWNAMRNTALLVLMMVPSIVCISLILATLVNVRNPLQNFFKALFYVPVISSGIIVGVIWKWIYHGEFGVLNYVIGLLGFDPLVWLANRDTALPAVAIVNVWRIVGYYLVIFLAGLQSIPSELYEAGTIDGASKLQMFGRITLPLLRPITITVVILATIFAFQSFDTIYVMTSGGPAEATSTAVWRIYFSSFIRFRPGYGAAMGFVLFLFIFAISLVQIRLTQKETFGAVR
jgi:putative chitobiose transport system permease protein